MKSAPENNISKIKIRLCMLAVLFIPLIAFSQSKKEVRKYRIVSTAVVDNENGKTLNCKKTVFDKDGETVEELDYDKEGNLKVRVLKKYNSDGDVVEETETNVKDNETEKRIYKYNSLGEKSEEQVYDGSGKKIKTHYYTYDSNGLKKERKTVDGAGKVVNVRKYSYTFR